MASGYLLQYQRAGLKVTLAEMEKLAIADCEMVDNARAAGELAPPSAPATPRSTDDRARAQEVIAQETGTRMVEPGHRYRPKAFDMNPVRFSERWGYAAGRIKRILEEIQPKSSSLTAAVEGAGSSLRALAMEYIEAAAAFYHLRGRATIAGKPNPYFGVSDKDASRMFVRAVEDICDRSTGKLGHWWLKK